MMGDVVFKLADERTPDSGTILIDGVLEGVCHILYTPSGCLRIEERSFDAFVEQLYLHSNYFAADASVPKAQGLESGKYVLVRYIAYDAHHDLSVNAVRLEDKKLLVGELAKRYRVVLSLESEKDRKRSHGTLPL